MGKEADYVGVNQESNYETLTKAYDNEVSNLITNLEDCNDHIELLSKVISEQAEHRRSQREELDRVKCELKSLKQLQKQKSEKLNNVMKKLGNLSARNVNKKNRAQGFKNQNP